MHILDNDLYKFTMQQAVFYYYPDVEVEYRLINRSARPLNLSESSGNRWRLMHLLYRLCEQKVNWIELRALKQACPYFTKDYLNYLSDFSFDIKQLEFVSDEEIRIKGKWLDTILWEVPLMAAISRTLLGTAYSTDELETRTTQKFKELIDHGIKIVDFGTRRRRCFLAHNHMLKIARKFDSLAGTSNVFLGLSYDMPVIGTMAHEWIMAHSVFGNQDHFNPNDRALRTWKKMYGNELSVALTDTYTSDYFFNDFNPHEWDGVRQDSGCAFEFIDKYAEVLDRRGIPRDSKKIVFSDGLNTHTIIEIDEYCRNKKILPAFGVGTFLTNDFSDQDPLNIVIKLWSVNNKPVAKLSDSEGKATGESSAINRAERMIGEKVNA